VVLWAQKGPIRSRGGLEKVLMAVARGWGGGGMTGGGTWSDSTVSDGSTDRVVSRSAGDRSGEKARNENKI